MKDWLQLHHSKFQFGLRMTLAALAAYAIGDAIGLSQVYWAVLSAVIVIQGSVGGSVKAGLNRMIGTVGGAAWGTVVAGLVVHDGPPSLALALFAAVAPLALLTGFRTEYRIAPITAIIVLMGASLPQATPFSSALERVSEITLGSAVAVAVALFIFPARAHALFARSAGTAIASMASLVSMFAESRGQGLHREALLKRQLQLNAEMEKLGARASEAKVERNNRLTDDPDPEPFFRTLRRIRNDITMLARALVQPLPHAVKPPFVDELTTALHALAAWLSSMPVCLKTGEEAPGLQDLEAAIDRFRAATAPAAGKKDMHRVFAILFAFEQTLEDLQDLVDRARELKESERERGS